MYTAPAPSTGQQRLSLKRRIIFAGSWTLAGYALAQALRLGSNLLMTRLLVPEMFGVMAIATTVMVGLAMFSDLGLKQGIVQSKRGGDPAYLNTAWMVQILRGLMLWLLGLGISLLILISDRTGLFPDESVYANPQLPSVIAVTSLSALIMGFSSTKVHEASRNLALGRVTGNGLIAQVIGLLCMLLWASFDRSIWALVTGGLSYAMVMAVLSHWRLPGTANRLQWDHAALGEIWHFGKWIFISSILAFAASQGDRLIIGGMVTTSTLGVYAIAILIFSAINQILMSIINEVAYPALSEIVRERPVDVKIKYYRFYGLIASCAFFCSGALMFSGNSLIQLLYDPRYAEAGSFLEILSVAIITVPFRLAASYLLALGLPRLFSHIIFGRVLSMCVLLPVGFHFWGLEGALWGLVISYFVETFMIMFYKRQHDLLDLVKLAIPVPAWFLGAFTAEAFNVLASLMN